MFLKDLIKNGDLHGADVAIVGVPFDDGVVVEGGRKGAFLAPSCIREQLHKYHKVYNLKHDIDLSALKICDLGDLDFSGKNVGEVHEKILRDMSGIFEKYPVVIVLGGGHDSSYSTIRAFSGVRKGLISGINLDAHTDVKNRDDFGSGTIFGRVIREGFLKGENFAEMGMHDNFSEKEDVEFLRKNNCLIVPFFCIDENGVEASFSDTVSKVKGENTLFMSVDIDCVAEAFAPGCSAPSSDGFSPWEVIRLSYLAGRQKGMELFEVMEVNPEFDIDNRTCRLAATMIVAFLTGLVESKCVK